MKISDLQYIETVDNSEVQGGYYYYNYSNEAAYFYKGSSKNPL